VCQGRHLLELVSSECYLHDSYGAASVFFKIINLTIIGHTGFTWASLVTASYLSFQSFDIVKLNFIMLTLLNAKYPKY